MSRYFSPISLSDFKTKVLTRLKKLSVEDEFVDPTETPPTGHDPLHFYGASYLAEIPPSSDFKVSFDTENMILGPQDYSRQNMGVNMDPILGFQVSAFTGMPYLGVMSGGDWEEPVYWVMYWDGAKLRAYIPTEGNCWNLKTKEAYGNDTDADLKDFTHRNPQLDSAEIERIFSKGEGHTLIKPDPSRLLEDIQNRIQKR